MPPPSIAILGAGITGLTATYRLSQRGHRVRLFEASERVGGAIRTEIDDGGWLIEAGPNSMLANEPLAALLDELDLVSECLTANPEAKNRYIVRRGVPVPAPFSPPALLRSPLFSMRAKARIFAEMLTRPRSRRGDVSLEDFVRDHFGQEVVDYGLNPFVTGVYAGDPKRLSARYAFPKLREAERQHGSLLRGQIDAAKKAKASLRAMRASRAPGNDAASQRAGVVSFRAGLQTLPDALAVRLPTGALTLNAAVERLVRSASIEGLPLAGRPPRSSRAAGGGAGPATSVGPTGEPWRLTWREGMGAAAIERTESFNAVIAALPAPALARLHIGADDESPLAPLASLAAIEHPPVSSLFLGYRREQVAHPLDGFGLLVPERERRAFLGVLFSSSLFPGRAPAGHVALTVLVGGTRDPELARLPTDPLIAAVALDLQQLLGVEGAPVFSRHVFWSQAIPQYNLGYEAHLETMSAVERAHPGLFIGGQARDGISLPACLAAGERLARLFAGTKCG